MFIDSGKHDKDWSIKTLLYLDSLKQSDQVLSLKHQIQQLNANVSQSEKQNIYHTEKQTVRRNELSTD